MILLPVDEAFAFDVFAIALVKANHDLPNEDEVDRLYDCLSRIHGFNRIMESSEFWSLYDANDKTFKMVEKAKSDKCSASDVDRMNYKRFQAKMQLQQKFWPKNPPTEVKTKRDYA